MAGDLLSDDENRSEGIDSLDRFRLVRKRTVLREENAGTEHSCQRCDRQNGNCNEPTDPHEMLPLFFTSPHDVIETS
jgi:hypothetical protein